VVALISPLRTAFLSLFFIGLFFLALGNLFVLQIFEHPFFAGVGQRQYEVTLTQKSARAPIFDHSQTPLAMNKEVLSVFITPRNLKDASTVTAFLKKNFPKAHERLIKKQSACFMYVKRHLTEAELDLITTANLEDLRLLRETSRFYPLHSVGHTVGTTDIDNQGLSGLELIFDARLSGRPSVYRLEKDARSHFYYFEKKTTDAGVDGQSVTLTLDSDLQFITYDTLKNHIENVGAKEGEALIMDPCSGDLLALACYPDFDSNLPLTADLSLTKNKIFTETREFGSVMKVFTALSALEEGVVKPDEIIDCEGRKETRINGFRVSTWKAFGKLTYTDVIRTSNNIGTSKVALRLGEKLYDYLRRCGFANPTGLQFPGEQKGYITPPSKWSNATPLTLSFGYEISATMLQLARGFAMISNGGFLITPRLILNPTPPSEPFIKRAFSQRAIAELRDIITLNHEGNTALNGHIPGYIVMGKTGSANQLVNGHYDESKSIYTFAGIVEKGSYKRVIVVFVREPRPQKGHTYAATIAVPLFKEIAQQMLVREQIAAE